VAKKQKQQKSHPTSSSLPPNTHRPRSLKHPPEEKNKKNKNKD
jgi:hypothetical protein